MKVDYYHGHVCRWRAAEPYALCMSFYMCRANYNLNGQITFFNPFLHNFIPHCYICSKEAYVGHSNSSKGKVVEYILGGTVRLSVIFLDIFHGVHLLTMWKIAALPIRRRKAISLLVTFQQHFVAYLFDLTMHK